MESIESSNYRERSPLADALAWPSLLIADLDDASALAQAIVDTIRDPLLILDQSLRVVTANRAFHQTFRMSRQDIQGRPVYGLGDGQWDIPELRSLLEEVAPQHAVMEAYEVERNFPAIGRRSMLLNAREVFDQRNAPTLILLTIEDVTDRRAAEREIAELLQQKETLLQEMQHRVANSLQIIAGILLLKARTVQSEETRLHLMDAHQRVMSVAAVQQQLLASRHGEPRDRPLSLSTVRDPGSLDDGRQSPDFIEGPSGRRYGLLSRGGKHRPHCHRTCDQCIQACLCRGPYR
jgi:PAS domain S-box-containing protein